MSPPEVIVDEPTEDPATPLDSVTAPPASITSISNYFSC